MSNLNFDFTNFADLDEKLEAAALDILESTAEIVHVTDQELELMAEEIIFQEEVTKETWSTARKVGKFLLVNLVISLAVTFGYGKLQEPVANQPCTPSPDDVCAIQSSLPPIDGEGNVMRGW